MGKKEKRGRPRIRTAAYWREYYRLKQREWRAAHPRTKTGRKQKQRGKMTEPNAVTNAINYAKFFSRSHDAVIRVCDEAGNVIATHMRQKFVMADQELGAMLHS